MNEVYADFESKPINIVQDVLEYVSRAFNIPYGDSLEIKIRLPRKKIEQISKDMFIQYEKSGMIMPGDEVDFKGAVFTKFKTPQGQIEFIDNGE